MRIQLRCDINKHLCESVRLSWKKIPWYCQFLLSVSDAALRTTLSASAVSNAAVPQLPASAVSHAVVPDVSHAVVPDAPCQLKLCRNRLKAEVQCNEGTRTYNWGNTNSKIHAFRSGKNCLIRYSIGSSTHSQSCCRFVGTRDLLCSCCVVVHEVSEQVLPSCSCKT